MLEIVKVSHGFTEGRLIGGPDIFEVLEKDGLVEARPAAGEEVAHEKA